jgi:hypothetical protein
MLCPESGAYWRDSPPEPVPAGAPAYGIPTPPMARWATLLTQEDGWKRTGPPQPCVSCGMPAIMRSPTGIPQHRTCAEAEIATRKASEKS